MPADWVLSQRMGDPLHVKRRADLDFHDTFQESTFRAAEGVMNALSLSANEQTALAIYADLVGAGDAGDVQKLDEDAWNAIRDAFQSGLYVVFARDPDRLVWGAKVSAAFRQKVREICGRLRMDPNYLMACMAFESANSFSSSMPNGSGSGAIGLIQFMPGTFPNVTQAMLAGMTPEDQLDYVERYFRERKKPAVWTLEDVYMVILCPVAVGQPSSYPCYREPSKAYEMNKGLDRDGDGVISKYEAGAAVRAKLEEGKAFAR
jgi:hypothetical protein